MHIYARYSLLMLMIAKHINKTVFSLIKQYTRQHSPQHIATHCNTLQHTARQHTTTQFRLLGHSYFLVIYFNHDSLFDRSTNTKQAILFEQSLVY